MKYLTIAILILSPFFLSSQTPLTATETTGSIEPFIQIGISDYPLSIGNYGVIYWGENNTPETVTMEGKKKGHKFSSIAGIFNYMENQGYQYLTDVTKPAGYDNQKAVYLFRKKN